MSKGANELGWGALICPGAVRPGAKVAGVDGGQAADEVAGWDAGGGHVDGASEWDEERGDGSFGVVPEASAAEADGVVG